MSSPLSVSAYFFYLRHKMRRNIQLELTAFVVELWDRFGSGLNSVSIISLLQRCDDTGRFLPFFNFLKTDVVVDRFSRNLVSRLVMAQRGID